MKKYTHFIFAAVVVAAMPLLMQSGSLASEVLIFALAAMGCDFAQGYAVGRPMPAEVLPVWSRNWTQPRFNPARRFQAPG